MLHLQLALYLFISQKSEVLSVIQLDTEAVVSPDVRSVKQGVCVGFTLQSDGLTLRAGNFFRRTQVKLGFACMMGWQPWLYGVLNLLIEGKCLSDNYIIGSKRTSHD